MPQVDVEALVCGGGASSDRKIVCETLIDGNSAPEKPVPPATPPDCPAESFRLPVEELVEWVHRNAYYERKESTKGNANSNSNSNFNPNPNLSSSSQRISSNVKTKPSIIGLPKLQNSSYFGCTSRRTCRPSSVRFFPKQSKPAGKSAVPETEPASPKVSCIGRVKPKEKGKDDRRPDKPAPMPEKSWFWASFFAFLSCRQQKAVDCADKLIEISPAKKVPVGKISAVASAISEPPGLGGMMRFASGRRTASWDDSDVELQMNVDVAKVDPSDRDSLGSRRAVGPLRKVDCGRNWECVGPATV